MITIPFSSTRPRQNPNFFRPLQFMITDGVTLTTLMKSHWIISHPHVLPILSSLPFLDSQLPLGVLGASHICTPTDLWCFLPVPIDNAQCPQSHLPCACCSWILCRWESGPWCWLPGLTNLYTSKGQIERKKNVFLSEIHCVTWVLHWADPVPGIKTSLSLWLQHLSKGLKPSPHCQAGEQMFSARLRPWLYNFGDCQRLSQKSKSKVGSPNHPVWSGFPHFLALKISLH